MAAATGGLLAEVALQQAFESLAVLQRIPCSISGFEKKEKAGIKDLCEENPKELVLRVNFLLILLFLLFYINFLISDVYFKRGEILC